MSSNEPVKPLTYANLSNKLMGLALLASEFQQVANAVTSAVARSCNNDDKILKQINLT